MVIRPPSDRKGNTNKNLVAMIESLEHPDIRNERINRRNTYKNLNILKNKQDEYDQMMRNASLFISGIFHPSSDSTHHSMETLDNICLNETYKTVQDNANRKLNEITNENDMTNKFTNGTFTNTATKSAQTGNIQQESNSNRDNMNNTKQTLNNQDTQPNPLMKNIPKVSQTYTRKSGIKDKEQLYESIRELSESQEKINYENTITCYIDIDKYSEADHQQEIQAYENYMEQIVFEMTHSDDEKLSLTTEESQSLSSCITDDVEREYFEVLEEFYRIDEILLNTLYSGLLNDEHTYVLASKTNTNENGENGLVPNSSANTESVKNKLSLNIEPMINDINEINYTEIEEEILEIDSTKCKTILSEMEKDKKEKTTEEIFHVKIMVDDLKLENIHTREIQ